MKIKIIGCKDNTPHNKGLTWYKDKIGWEFEVNEKEPRIVDETKPYTKYYTTKHWKSIRVEDCEVI